MKKSLLKYNSQPDLKNPALVVGWTIDVGKLGTLVTQDLINRLEAKRFCEIEPVRFFPLGGVTIEENVLQFPESSFYASPEKDLMMFRSDPPVGHWHVYLNLVLDVAEKFHVREIHALGSLVSLTAHTSPRSLLGTFNTMEFKNVLAEYGMSQDMDFETPPGQRPTFNSYLLWLAQKRSIPAVSLWAPLPFYLPAAHDPGGQKAVMEYLNKRLNLGIDLAYLDEAVIAQNKLIAEARVNSSDIDEAIKKLENNQRLSEEESQKLLKDLEEAFAKKR